MAERMTRDAGDARVAYFSHGGRRVTVRLVDPKVGPNGKLPPDTLAVCQGVPGSASRDPVLVTGWVTPAHFEAIGLPRVGTVRYSIGRDNPFTVRLVIHDLSVTAAPPPYAVPWSMRDVPMGKLLRAALMVATCEVRYTPGKPGRDRIIVDGKSMPSHRIIVDGKWNGRVRYTDAFGRLEPLRLGGRAEDRDLAQLATGVRPKRGSVPHFLSPAALREVARYYAEAPPQADRPGLPVEMWIGQRTHRAPGTVRRQITEARARGFIVANTPSTKAHRDRRAASRRTHKTGGR